MTLAARIKKADYERAAETAIASMKRIGASQARIIARLDRAEIEIIIGESAELPDATEWDRE